jgi:hypothetical protein
VTLARVGFKTPVREPLFLSTGATFDLRGLVAQQLDAPAALRRRR